MMNRVASSFRGIIYHRFSHSYHHSVNISIIATFLKPSVLSSSLGNPPIRYQQQLQFRSRSTFKVRRRRRRRVQEKLAALAAEDQPDVMEDVVYITTFEEADEWAKTTVVEHIIKYVHTSRTILAGVYASWQYPPKIESDDETANVGAHDANLDTADTSHHDLQRSLLSREAIIFGLEDDPDKSDVPREEEKEAPKQKWRSRRSPASDDFALEDDSDNADRLEHEEKFNLLSQETDAVVQEDGPDNTTISHQGPLLSMLQISVPKAPVAVLDFAAMRRNAHSENGDQEDVPRPKFPKYLKYLLQLPSLVVCAVQANALVDQLLLHYNVNCLTRADLVDMARCALSYQEGFQSTASFDFDQLASSTIPVVLDELFYQFFGPVNRDEVLRFERPPAESSIQENDQPLSEEQVRYYAAHAYHARLLAATMIETVDLSEATLYHEDDEALVYLCDPNIPFHPTLDRLPEMLTYGHKVALLTEIDDEYDDEQRRRTRSRRHRILASGKVEFVGEPYGITRRFPGTSYLVGQHEEEAIVRLKKVARPHEPVPLCRGYKYWQHPSQEGDKPLDWPDSPTLSWVLENVKPPWILVEKSRLELIKYIQDLPTDKPWMPKKKTDDLPGVPLDISKFI